MELWIVLVVLGASVVALFLLRRKTRASNPIAPYSEIKRRIRAGETPPDDDDSDGDADKPSLPMAQIFEIRDPLEFYLALSSALFDKSMQLEGRLLNATERGILGIYGLEMEVNNGGFDQYFFNSFGDTSRDALHGLELVGAVSVAELLRKAMSVFPGGAPSEQRETRWKQTDALREDSAELWSELNRKFYEYPDNLADLVSKYSRHHREEFSD